MRYIKKKIRQIVRWCGWDLVPISPTSTDARQLLLTLEHAAADVVIDIGANTGQFARNLRFMGFRGTIVSIEPLAAAHAELVEHARGDKLWKVVPRMALGCTRGQTMIHVASNSVSSSVLPMLPSHHEALPASAYCGVESVPMCTLDGIVNDYCSPESRIFLKLDTQGYEWEVLDGGEMTLARAVGIQCELSLTPLYEGQRLWREMIDRLEANGFMLWALSKAFIDEGTARTLQVDGVFTRRRDV